MPGGVGTLGKLAPLMRSTVEALAHDDPTGTDPEDPDTPAGEGDADEDAHAPSGRPRVQAPRVKLAVDIDEEELAPAIEQAWREIAKEVRLPGFRPGKAPRRLLEQQFGATFGRSEALKQALPDFYSRAVIEHEIDVIAPPELDITDGAESGPVRFEAVVEVRPEVTVAGYGGLRVEVPSPEVPDDEVDEQIDRLRSQYGELAEVDRPAAEGDYVRIDIHGTQDGEPVDGLTADDYLYLVGSGAIASEFDEHLRGAGVGDVLEFDAEHPDPDEDGVHFRLLVKDVQERVLPDLDDAWVADATEFGTVDELRADIRSNLAQSRVEQTRLSVRARIGTELARLVDEDLPESLVAGEMQARLEGLLGQLQARGIQVDDYLRLTGQDPQSFTSQLREAADEAVRVDLALRSVASAESLEPSDEEVDEEVARLIVGTDLDLDEAKAQLRDGGQLSAVRSDLLRRKALEWLVEHSEVVDPDGTPIPEELLQLPEDDDHTGHDHDHDGHDHDH
jgi:trigger factor